MAKTKKEKNEMLATNENICHKIRNEIHNNMSKKNKKKKNTKIMKIIAQQKSQSFSVTDSNIFTGGVQIPIMA